MDIFENLEQLNVSEECFNDIMDIVEDILGAINRSNKSEKKKDELYNKSREARYDEFMWSDLYRKRDPRFKSSTSEIRCHSRKNNDDRTKKKRRGDVKMEFSKGGRPIYTRNGKMVDFKED